MSLDEQAPAPAVPPAPAAPAPGGVASAFAVPLVLGAGLGALGGWLWWRWWSPAPVGRVYDTSAGRVWYPDPFDPGLVRDFSGTAEYVVLGLGLGLLLGLVAGAVARRRPVAGLVATLLGAVLAAGLAAGIGLAQSPVDPQTRVDSVKVGTKLPGHLVLAKAGEIDLPGSAAIPLTTPWLAWPVGALLGFLGVMLLIGVLEQRAVLREADPRAPRPTLG